MSDDLSPLPLTRAQIAQSITGDPRSIRAIEALFQQAYQALPAGSVLTWETSSAYAAGRVATGSPGLDIDISTPEQALFAVQPNTLPVAVGGSQTRTLTAILADAANVNDYLNSGDTTYDGAVARALTAKGAAAFVGPPSLGGTDYIVAAPIEPGARQALIGEGSGYTRLMCSTANVPVIAPRAAIANLTLTGLYIGHSGVATAGGDGIQCQGTIDTSDFEDIRAEANWVGFNLKNAPYTTVRRCVAAANKSIGYRMASAIAAELQYYFQQCIAASNGGDGWRYEATAAGPGGGAGISVGALNECFTFNNNGRGVAVLGRNDLPIYSVRIEGGFYGQDKGHEIYLDAYGNNHIIRPSYVELAGNSVTWGVDTTGCGIELTGNDIIGAGAANVYGNAGSLIAPGRVNGSQSDNIFIEARDCSVGPHVSSYAGQAGGAGRGSGVYLFGANAGVVVTGMRAFGCFVAGFASNQDNFILSGCDLRGNTAPTALSAGTTANTIITGCLPGTINLAVFGDVTTETLHVHAAAAFTGTGATKGVSILDGGLALTAGVAGNGIDVDNVHARVSLGVGTAAPGTVGTISATAGFFSGGLQALALTSLAGISAGGPLSGVTSLAMSGALSGATTITASVDIISNGQAHFNGAVAFTAGGVNITAGGLAVAGGIGVDNIAVTGAIYNPAATGASKGPGTINLAGNYYLNNVVH